VKRIVKLEFRKGRGISWLTEELHLSREGLRLLDLAGWFEYRGRGEWQVNDTVGT
jgi:hypothetical protein